ncbi:MAG TPA: hypothetical protein VKY74_05965, partial [Chloroflexia bacterium]|nr:hypothetical protein [Chloroflexia bacterium]
MRKLIAGLAIVLLAGLVAQAPLPAGAQTAGRFFPETGYSLQGGFLAFWQAHGGYAVFGPPITPERQVADSNGRLYTDQYLANAV